MNVRSACWGPAILVTSLLACGCTRPVQRSAETIRFRDYLNQQTRRLDIQPAVPLSMAQCEQLALANSLDLTVRNLALRLQDEQIRLALSNGLPKGNLQFVDVARSKPLLGPGADGPIVIGDKHAQNMIISVLQPALDWGLTWYSCQIAVDRKHQEQLLIRRAEQLLCRDVRIAYTQHAGAIRQARLAQTAWLAAEQVMRVARSLEKAQLAVKADTSLVEAALAEAALQLSLANQAVEQTHLVLSQLMSLPPAISFTIHDALPPMPEVPTTPQVSAFEDRALAVRPELAVQDLERHAAAGAVYREASAFFPRIDGIGNFNWTSSDFLINKTWLAGGFQVSSTLLDGGATIFRFNLARKAADVEKARTLLVSLGILYDVDLRALQVRTAHETIVAAQSLETARKEGLQRVLTLYREGLEDEAGAATALANLTVQATTLDRAQTDYFVAWHQLEAAVLPEASVATSQPAATQPANQAPATQPSTQPASPMDWLKAVYP
jgi:outer membrane protein TolC